MARLHMLAGCCLLACMLLAVSARPQQYDFDRYRAGRHEGPEHHEYNGDGPADHPHYHKEGPEHHHHHEEYDSHPDERYHQHQHSDDEEHYSGGSAKVETKTLVLQETSRSRVIDKNLGTTETYKFRCAEEADADACLHPEDSKYYADHSSRDDSFFDSVVGANEAAVCTWTYKDEQSCPAALLAVHPACEVVQMNCSISKQAEKCGCPFPGGMTFSTVGYYFFLPGLQSCEAKYEPKFPDQQQRLGVTAPQPAATAYYRDQAANVTLYNVTGDVFVAPITFMNTPYGYKETKATLQFFKYMFDTPPTRSSRPGRKAGGKKAAGLKAGLSSPHYYGDDDHKYEAGDEHTPRHYHGEEEEEREQPYGHDDYDRHHDGPADDSYYPAAYGNGRDHKKLYKGGSLTITLTEKAYY